VSCCNNINLFNNNLESLNNYKLFEDSFFYCKGAGAASNNMLLFLSDYSIKFYKDPLNQRDLIRKEIIEKTGIYGP
jgi:hypothetical protein